VSTAGHHPRAASAESTETGGTSRLVGCALAARGAFVRSNGSGARSIRLLATVALAIAGLLALAVPAIAAPPTATTPEVSEVSYTSGHVTGKVTTDGSGTFGTTTYNFQYSTDQVNWQSAPGDAEGFLHGAGANQSVEAHINGLEGGTHYFIRLTAHFLGGPVDEATSPGPDPSFTTLVADPPTMPGTVGVSPVFSTSATATGTVRRPGKSDDVSCHFEYISDEQFTGNQGASLSGFEGAASVDCVQNPIGEAEAEVDKSVSAEISGLSPSTTYHLRLVADNAAPGVVIKDADATFTTQPPVDKPTVLAVDDVVAPGQNTAEVTGEVQRPVGEDPALNVECRFEYVSDQQFNETGFEGAPAAPCVENPITAATADGEGKQKVSTELTGLRPETVYHFRLAVENSGGIDRKDSATTFTTIAAELPVVTIDPVAGETFTTAHVSGTVDIDDPGHSTANAAIEISTDGGASWSDFTSSEVSIPGQHPGINVVERTFTGLQPSTTYSFRILATYSGAAPEETEERGEMAFSPEPNPSITTEPLFSPTAEGLEVTNVTSTAAHLSGAVDPHAPAGPLSELGKQAFATHWTFECTPECLGPGAKPLVGTVQGEEGPQPVSVDAIRLRHNTFYEVRLTVVSEGGSGTTDVQTFQTPLVVPDVSSTDGGSDGEGGYTIQGVVDSNNSKLTRCEFDWGPTSNYPNVYKAPCLPSPSGADEIQNVAVDATEGQFRLSFRGETTSDLAFNATTDEVQAALRAVSSIGSPGVIVGGSPQAYEVTFAGPLAGANIEPIKALGGTTPLGNGGGVSVSTATEGGSDHPVTVEAHLEDLTVGAVYHFRIFATNAAGESSSSDRIFVPTLAPGPQGCDNEELRKESSSLALPECRAYEMVTSPAKGGLDANLRDFGEGVARYNSAASNIAGSGAGQYTPQFNNYVSARTSTGWETLANLNGPTGSMNGPPLSILDSFPFLLHYSSDFRSSIWAATPASEGRPSVLLRNPDGTFAPVGTYADGFSSNRSKVELMYQTKSIATDDLTHLVFNGKAPAGGGEVWGQGVYEFVGTGNDQPSRVDVDNSDSPISGCINDNQRAQVAEVEALSSDGRVIVTAVYGGCGGSNPPTNQVWARVAGTTSYEVSASKCTRSAGDTGGPCAEPEDALFAGASVDGSQVFFTTAQQLVNDDTDETNDLYVCEIPLGVAPQSGRANSCTTLTRITGATSGARVEDVLATSDNGNTAYFTAAGVLADNDDALGEQAVSGGHNVYAWRRDSANPLGQITFVGRSSSEDLTISAEERKQHPQVTPDGRYLLFNSRDSFVPTDTDTSADIYRYDAKTDNMTRISTGASGTGGNGDGFDAVIAEPSEHQKHPAIADDGQRIVFTTKEALSPLDGNGATDTYLWASGHVVGSVAGETDVEPSIDGTGRDIYFETASKLTSGDGDSAIDVYDARLGGGFPASGDGGCSGESCQPPAAAAPADRAPASGLPGSGSPITSKKGKCPKGKVRKHGKCVGKYKRHKKHHRTASHRRRGHNGGGGQ
jgi:hypothetical protein